MTYAYGEIFEKLGCPGMGRQGAPWCGTNKDGVLVLMAHANKIRPDENKQYWYKPDGHAGLADSSASAKRSLRLIQDYFAPGKPVILPVGMFIEDGGPDETGKIKAARFDHATGSYYNAVFREFEFDSGHMICEISSKVDL